MFQNAKPIWWTQSYLPDEYMQAKEELLLNIIPASVTLRISAGTDYTVYINGQLAAFGQYACRPDHRVYDEVDIAGFMVPGKNEITLLGYHCGSNFFTHTKGPAFLCYEIETDGQILLSSGPQTQVRPAPGYLPHRKQSISPQLGFTYAYDFTRSGGAFRDAEIIDIGNTAWEIRPVEKLVLEDRCNAGFVHQGLFQIPEYAGITHAKPEKDMQYAALSFRTLDELSGTEEASRLQSTETPLTFTCPERTQDQGIYWIVDLGGETAGFLDLELTVSEDCDLLVGYGEHLVDGRCRTGIRNFSCALHLRAGRNQFLNTFRRFGCRYLQFFVFTSRVTVHYSGLRPTLYPVKKKRYKSGNLLRDTIYEVAQNTLLQCMHEHYEDTPWREQSMYAMDSRNQMLCGYYAFGETKFPRACLKLISQGQRPDGLLTLCHPAGRDRPIISFPLVWILSMWEYISHSGDTTLAKEAFPVMERLLDAFRQNTDADGLTKTFRNEEQRYWNFYEWSPTMDGYDEVTETEAEAPLNAFYCIALDSMVKICDALGRSGESYRMQADHIRAKLVERFFRQERGLFASFLSRHTDRYSVLTNALCLLCGAADELNTVTIEELLANNARGISDGIPDTLSMQGFRFDALLRKNKEKYGHLILDELDRTCLHMLRQGATSFWETIQGEADFLGAGSLCHGWSALVIYYYELLNGGIKNESHPL